jgi:uncharacterized membrane protein YfcA
MPPWPLSPLATAWCALALAAGYGVRAVSGFGAGVIATPLLTFVLPMSVTVPLITVIGGAASLRQVLRDWRSVEWPRLAILVPGSLAGIAVGLYIFKTIDQVLLARALGIYILLYAMYSLFGGKVLRRRVAMPRWLVHPVAALAGLVATIFGGLAGAIYATYLDALALSKGVFRVTMSAVLLLLAVARSIGYLATGVFRAEDLVLIAAAFLPVAIGTILGDRLHDRLDPLAFRRVIGVLLVASGAGLLFVH